MVTRTKYGSVKRLGVRYGRKVKEKLGKVEKIMFNSTLCPYCRKTKMKRLAAGIWSCLRCNVKVAGGAYSVQRMIDAANE